MIIKLHNPLDKCEIKFAKGDSDKNGEFSGYLAGYGNEDSDGDIIEPGAFASSIKDKTPTFINHDSREIPVGFWKDLKEDDKGLYGTGVIDMNHHLGPSLKSAIKIGSLNGISVGFMSEVSKERDDHPWGRYIERAQLKEASAVTFPANDEARIDVVKSDLEGIMNIRGVEMFLRDLGLSRSMATASASQFKSALQSDSVDDYKEQIAELKAKLMEYERRLGVQTRTESLVQAIKNRKF